MNKSKVFIVFYLFIFISGKWLINIYKAFTNRMDFLFIYNSTPLEIGTTTLYAVLN